jgi:hypothetical protein
MENEDITQDIIRQFLTCAWKTCELSTSDKKFLALFKRKVLRSTYDPIKDNNKWRIRYNYELYPLYEDKDIITFIKVEGLKGLVMLFEWTSKDLRKESLMPNEKAEKIEEGLN